MGLIIRTALLVGIGVMLIPADPAELEADGLARKADAFATLGFAKAAYDDASGFCQRNPDACETGSALAASFGAKARTGAKWVYGWLSPAAPAAAPAVSPVSTPDRRLVPTQTIHAGPSHAGPSHAGPGLAADPLATGSVPRPPAPPVPKPKPLAS